MKKINYRKSVTIFEHNNHYYVRTREIADLFDIKQPFKFNAFLKKKCKVLKDEETEAFRDKNIDLSQTTFVDLSVLFRIFKDNETYFEKVAHNYTAGIAAIQKTFNNEEFIL